MKACITLEQRFCSTADGVVWTPNSFAYPFWQRYLNVFDEVRVVARVLNVDRPRESWTRVDGPRVSVVALPHYVGPLQYMMKRRSVLRGTRRGIAPKDAVILRLPSAIGALAAKQLERGQRPYGVEVVGDPWDMYGPGAVRHPLRPFFRRTLSRQLRQLVRRAAAAAYVTESALQRRYPPRRGAFTTHYSSIELPPEAFVPASRTYASKPRRVMRLVSVGTLAQMYKAPDVVIEAVAQCARNSLDVELVWVGDGKCRRQVEELARRTGCAERCRFLGSLSGASAVRQTLDRADLFVLASRQEGLPRAMIEAMARGLPCFGSTVGGTPELLPEECLVPLNDAATLARKIDDFRRSPKKMEEMSRRNLDKAREYRDEVLSKRRTEFYHYVRETTERWQKESRQ